MDKLKHNCSFPASVTTAFQIRKPPPPNELIFAPEKVNNQ
jgi:hypothetical protein